MATGFLKTSGPDIVDETGNKVLLRGTSLGGWMLMENFMDGFPGKEVQIRHALRKVLGQEKSDFFFDKFLEYFFTEPDAKFLASLGVNLLRLPFNYRHLEDDMNPMVINEEGFRHLDRVIDLCARYRSNPWVAGYDPLNEPADSEGYRIAAFYDRLVPTIREVDPHHILFLEGNGFGTDFTAFDSLYENTAWSIHDYCFYAFPHGGIGTYQGRKEQDEFIRQQYQRRIAFMRKHNVPIWIGEFGMMYEREDDNPNWEAVNQERYNMLSKQMAMYDSEGIAWCIWSYKDINIMGMIHTSPSAAWYRLLHPMIAKKKALDADCAYGDAHLEDVFGPLHRWFGENVPEKYRNKYPPQISMRQQVTRATRDFVLSDYMVPEFADYFRDKTLDELDELAASWKFENCVQRYKLNEVMKFYAPLKPGDPKLNGDVIPKLQTA
ncbi:glycoside hydrolase superfamily [Lipomyces kononenkoae]|uniref:Glycoside hydrolase superfamily n=1 Tax=Lipomyces kononenkoae TaxID=34357 RepID=A0ACC3STT0_LIPKO